MEVHHHPKVGKKNFKEYLLEGLMIFIAVMLGFFAESLREHISDQSKEREYISSLKKDLAADTTNINSFVSGFNTRIHEFDTLINMLQHPLNVPNGSEMYYLARLATRGTVFGDINNTLAQLNSSGNFRLISSRIVADNIVLYENHIENFKEVHDIDTKEQLGLYPYLGALFNAFVFDSMMITVTDTSADPDNLQLAHGFRSAIQRPSGNPQLINTNAGAINSLVYDLDQRKGTFVAECRLLYEQKEQAKKLIGLINKEYHFSSNND
jgi:hypothetical protein